jgi:predicted DCC family thiol-disulfide oxidoreductase YuxK
VNKPKAESDSFLICFDGYCLLCNAWVDFLIKRDRNNIFTFTSLQSNAGRNVLLRNGYSECKLKALDSIVVVNAGKISTRSDAVIEILVALGGLFKMARLLKLIPSSFRNLAYDTIAKKRYIWVGRRDTCRIPLPEELHKFLE